ncbi:hypothetical protein K458DRAFT_390502 [Lentithecium fluviatile CBS 122367]|uniref:Uncharacterized protein n=1 Tax=Lentithecium fluviatile CBS 122367 TaxID=1168545 RepID=A0A6G1IWT5_9PLEO|nr:hypothetical protein K458DRAFT_390502 [Lentithecium fluviatile CBS 122367]
MTTSSAMTTAGTETCSDDIFEHGMDSKHRKEGSTTTDSDKTVITLMNQKQSPLLRLPGEIRNQIYSYRAGITWLSVTAREYRTKALLLHPTQIFGALALRFWIEIVFEEHGVFVARRASDGTFSTVKRQVADDYGDLDPPSPSPHAFRRGG